MPTTGERGRRRGKSNEESERRMKARLKELQLSETQQMELLSIIAELFCSGCSSRAEVEKAIVARFPKPFGSLFSGENYWDLVRLAARYKLFVHEPSVTTRLATLLYQQADWLRDRTTVVETASPDALAMASARKLLEMIRELAATSPERTVHVGCAGAWTMRSVAIKLSQLLKEDHPHNPRALVFHAMVAGFDEDDFQVDPNSFIHCLVDGGQRIKIRFLRLPMPGIVTREEYLQLREMPSIRRTLQRASEIQIIVTSGSLLDDNTSTLRTFFNSLAASDPACRVDELFECYRDAGVIGDLLWQPLTADGVADLDLPYRVATLMSLHDVQEFLRRSPSNRVLAVLGRSTMTGMPKSKLLDVLVRSRARLISDLVVDTPTLNCYLEPSLMPQYYSAPAPPSAPR
jgi:hypothetical protein